MTSGHRTKGRRIDLAVHLRAIDFGELQCIVQLDLAGFDSLVIGDEVLYL